MYSNYYGTGSTGYNYGSHTHSYGSSMTAEEKEEIRKKRLENAHLGDAGLRNIGNTCYFNAAIQCIARLTELRDLLMRVKTEKIMEKGATTPTLIHSRLMKRLRKNMVLKQEAKLRKEDELEEDEQLVIDSAQLTKLTRHTLTQRLRSLIKMMYHDYGYIIKPRAIKKQLGECDTNTHFGGFGQQDAHELLTLVFSTLHEELAAPRSVIKLRKMTPGMRELIRRRTEANLIYKNPKLSLAVREKARTEFVRYRLDHSDDYLRLKAFVTRKNEVIKPTSRWSPIKEMFGGTSFNSSRCMECGFMSGTFQIFTLLTVPIPDGFNLTLADCLKEYSAKEVLLGDNQWRCERCDKLVDCERQVSLYDLPQYLVIHLGRFKSDMYGNQRKIHTKVTVPIEELDIADNVSPVHSAQISHFGTKYRLVGTCNQSGSLAGGHYTANVRSAIDGKTWVHCNDERVTRIPPGKVDGEVNDPTTYILFYKRIVEGDDEIIISNMSTEDAEEKGEGVGADADTTGETGSGVESGSGSGSGSDADDDDNDDDNDDDDDDDDGGSTDGDASSTSVVLGEVVPELEVGGSGFDEVDLS